MGMSTEAKTGINLFILWLFKAFIMAMFMAIWLFIAQNNNPVQSLKTLPGKPIEHCEKLK